jgi:hypothetical protein
VLLAVVLTVLLIVIAGLGVLNTVVLQIRDRAHDLGVFKAIGMTPRQTLTMVTCSVCGTGIAAACSRYPACSSPQPPHWAQQAGPAGCQQAPRCAQNRSPPRPRP